jgi:hypothetical protein
MYGIIFVLSVVTAVFSAIGFFYPSKESAVVATAKMPVGQAEVSDLIERLKPLAKDPNGAWYSNGIQVSFTGSDVRITLKMPNDNEYHGEAKTLTEAVSRITSPSKDISDALLGWRGNK